MNTSLINKLAIITTILINWGFSVKKNINLNSLNIKSVNLINIDDQLGKADLIIKFNKNYNDLVIHYNNFLNLDNYLDCSFNRALFNNMLPSYIFNNIKAILSNKVLFNNVYQSFLVNVLNYNDNEATTILTITDPTNSKTKGFYLKSNVNSLDLLQNIFKIKNYQSNYDDIETINNFKSKYTTINQLFNLKQLNILYDPSLLSFCYLNANSNFLTIKLTYNHKSLEDNIYGFVNEQCFNEFKEFNKIKFSTPYALKFNNSTIQYDDIRKYGFYNISDQLDLNKFKVDYDSNNKITLNYNSEKVFKKTFDLKKYNNKTPEKSIDDNVIHLFSKFTNKQIKKDINIKCNKNYQVINKTINDLFNDVYIKNGKQNIRYQIEKWIYNILDNFVAINLIENNIKIKNQNFIFRLLNAIRFNYDFNQLNNQLLFNIQVEINNNHDLNINNIYFIYKNKKLYIEQGNKLTLNYYSLDKDKQKGYTKIEPTLTNNYIDFNIIASKIDIVQYDNNIKNKFNKISDTFNTISYISSIFSLGLANLHCEASSTFFAILSLALTSAAYIIYAISNWFIPSYECVKNSRPLDLNYHVDQAIWEIYVNGFIANSNQQKILNSFKSNIQTQHSKVLNTKVNVFNIINSFLKGNESQRNIEYIINDNVFRSNLIDILQYLVNIINNKQIIYRYLLINEIKTSKNINELNLNLSKIIVFIANNEIKKIININLNNNFVYEILNNINNKILSTILNYSLNSNPVNIENEINNIDTFINSYLFKQLITSYLKQININDNEIISMQNTIISQWSKMYDIYQTIFTNLFSWFNKYKNNHNVFNDFITQQIYDICKYIYVYYQKDQNNIDKLLWVNSIKPKMIMSLIRMISTYNETNDFTKIDIINLISSLIRYKNINLDNYFNNYISKKNRITEMNHYVGGPYYHAYNFFNIDERRTLDLFNFVFSGIYNSSNQKISLNDFVKSTLNYSYSYDNFNVNINQNNNYLNLLNGNLRTIINENKNKYYLKKELLYDFINYSKNTMNSTLITYKFWNRKYYKITLKDLIFLPEFNLNNKQNQQNKINQNLVNFIIDKQDYRYRQFNDLNKNIKFNYEFDNNEIKWSNINQIKFGVPVIKSNLIDITTHNILRKSFFDSNIGANDEYCTNFIKEFVRSFYELFYDLE